MPIMTYLLAANDVIPNNPACPLIVYPQAVAISGTDPAAAFEALFAKNGWPPAWRNGVFPFHHFHSNAHEVLGIYSGEVTVCFGGDGGPELTAGPGDVIVVPAGVGHKRVAMQGRLGIVGAYPEGQSPDLCEPGAALDPAWVTSVKQVARPGLDPVSGSDGPLMQHW